MEVISVNNTYASGFKRLMAYFIDHMFLSVIFSIFFWRIWTDYAFWDGDYPFHFTIHYFKHNLLYQAVVILYYALMESSAKQATFGKIVTGIKVVDRNNQRLTLGQALLRNISKLLSALLLG